MTVGRREFLGLAGVIAATVGMPAAIPQRRREVKGATTLERTLVPGRVIREGELRDYRAVAEADGEPHVVRDDLAEARAGREARRRSLVSFAHLTDQHVIDVQSTTRVEFLDRYADGGCGDVLPLASSHRPHEAASARIADAMLRQIRAIGAAPVSGEPLQAAICTGDNTDNLQGNELETFLGLMNGSELTGAPITPQSGDDDEYEGVQRSGDRAYWHPDRAGAGEEDYYKTLFGFPDVPGWLEQALAPFEAVGVGMPWFSCYGNHDGLAQGTSPVLLPLQLIAESGLKVVGVPDHVPCHDLEAPSLVLDQLTALGAPAMWVAADSRRQYVSRRDWMRAHLDSPGSPHGHGFAEDNVDGDVAYYVHDVGEVRWIVLDTVNPGGLSNGSIGRRQLDWLAERLAEADEERKLVLLFSHHGPRSLDNPLQTPGPDGADLPRHTADDVLAVVAEHPCVVAWVNGHTHENLVTAREGRFWDVGTAAHVDWPAQSRLVEVFDNGDGTLSLFTTMVDHADDDVATPSRELAANDPQHGFDKGTGSRTDRNAELLLPHPFATA
ncbi:MAG: TIGR03767 family metallophosphoesterase [Stackebrandtia sp.]